MSLDCVRTYLLACYFNQGLVAAYKLRKIWSYIKIFDLIPQVLEETMVDFVKSELKKIKTVVESDGLSEIEEVMGGNMEKQRLSSRDAVLEITANFLREMKQEEVAESLQKSKNGLKVPLKTL